MLPNFAASTSLGICLGPTTDACIAVTINASQSSAAGFDGLAGTALEKNRLTTLYTDVIDYAGNDNTEHCVGELMVSTGYWMYVQEPSVTVAFTTPTFVNASDVLYKYEGGILRKARKTFCNAIGTS